MIHLELTEDDFAILLEAQDELTQQQQQDLNISVQRTEDSTWIAETTKAKVNKLINMLHYYCFTANKQQREQAKALQRKLLLLV